MNFKEHILEFYEDKILDTSTQIEVMMEWESPIMEKTASFICESRGDILEIGFGMGICSNFIQSHNVKSHTIIEIHPQIIELAEKWAENKDNVNIVKGDWSTLDLPNKYDGIFLDTFGDNNLSKYKEFVLLKSNPNCNISYWNNFEKEENEYDFENIEFEIVNVIVEPNKYTDIASSYYMPKVTI